MIQLEGEALEKFNELMDNEPDERWHYFLGRLSELNDYSDLINPREKSQRALNKLEETFLVEDMKSFDDFVVLFRELRAKEDE